jgi:Flp pilus assembly protein TadB
MEIVAFLAFLILAWLSWQLVKAKRFTRFKQQIDNELKNKVIANIKQELTHTRCEGLPNNDSHQAATIFYWTQYKSRILHAALSREIISQEWLINSGNLRNAQHLFFIEGEYLPTKSSLIKSTD